MLAAHFLKTKTTNALGGPVALFRLSRFSALNDKDEGRKWYLSALYGKRGKEGGEDQQVSRKDKRRKRGRGVVTGLVTRRPSHVSQQRRILGDGRRRKERRLRREGQSAGMETVARQQSNIPP